MKLIFNVPGDWTSPWLLIRLLEVVKSPWTANADGFGNHETGETVSLGYGARIPGLEKHFAKGTDASRNPLSDDILTALAAHQGVFQIQKEVGDAPLVSLRTALRATNAVVDGGATAVQCVASGLVHEADQFQILMAAVEAADDDQALKAAMYAMVVRYQFGKLPMTFGMACFGLPDVVLTDATRADRAIGLLERCALGPDLSDRAEPDRRGLPEHALNPYGIVRLTP